MTGPAVILALASLIGVALVWILPREAGRDAMAALGLATLALLSPVSALWLGGAAAALPFAMRWGDATGRRGAVTLAATLTLVAALFASRALPGPLWIGGAYFTLRHLHVLIDWWMGRLANPGLRRHLRYQLFLPVLAAGPIHRLPLFERQCARARRDPAELFSGAERALLGAAQAVILGGWAMDRIRTVAELKAAAAPPFLRDWLLSALDWGALYLSFAGLSSVALGLALMTGLRLEENFDRPWAARNLIEFWTRWHMTLSGWVRDYVFQPVTALSRAPLLGLVAAMAAMGLWHEVSAYYLLWAVWQVAGVVLARLWQRARLRAGIALPGWLVATGGPVFVLGWLALARPVILRLLEAMT